CRAIARRRPAEGVGSSDGRLHALGRSLTRPAPIPTLDVPQHAKMKLSGIALLSLGCLLAACVKVDGGAVEISWVIRSKAGSAITDCGCSSPSIAKVRLRLELVSGVDGGAPMAGNGASLEPCAGNAQCDFPCARQTGSTPFNIPETHGTDRYEVS